MMTKCGWPYMALMCVALFVVSGCTIYTVERTNDNTKVTVISSRDFEQPELHYKRDGDSAEFDFGAANAQTNSPLEAIGALAVERLLNTYTPAPATPSEDGQ